MKTIFAFIMATISVKAVAQTYLRPYIRSDGTLVLGNTNTGQPGNLSPYNPNRKLA